MDRLLGQVRPPHSLAVQFAAAHTNEIPCHIFLYILNCSFPSGLFNKVQNAFLLSPIRRSVQPIKLVEICRYRKTVVGRWQKDEKWDGLR